MKITKLISSTLVALSTLGMVAPQANMAFAADTTQADTAKVQLFDVALENGALRGAVVSPQGKSQADAAVTVSQNGKTVATTKTDKDGVFAVSNLKGGLYVVSTEGASGTIRAWTNDAAPPNSKKGVLLVPGGDVTRAQILDGVGLGGIIGLGIIGTIVTVAAVHGSSS